MKIAILSEAFTFGPILNELEQLGDITAYNDDTTTEEAVIERCKDIDVVLLNCWISPLSHEVLDNLPSVKLIAINTTGYNQIDVEYARSKGIAIANVPGYGTESVAEHALALLLAVNRAIPLANRQMHEKPFWIDPQKPEMQILRGRDLRDMTLGIVGLGAIGTRLADMGRALGMNVVAHNRTPREVPGVRLCNLEEVFQKADVVSINLAGGTETRHIVNANTLALMKRDAILISTARDEHIDVDALYDALKGGRIRGAGLDGIDLAAADHPILRLDSLVLTPHTGWYTKEAEVRLAHVVLEVVKSFAGGEAKNVVN